MSPQVDGPVNAEEGKPYEKGVQLSKNELSSYLQHPASKNLNLNSRCMLLWINVASFCVSLLTRDHESLNGILAGAVKNYCVSQVRYIWKLMKNNLQMTDEELSYLVMMCMRRYLQVCQ